MIEGDQACRAQFAYRSTEHDAVHEHTPGECDVVRAGTLRRNHSHAHYTRHHSAVEAY